MSSRAPNPPSHAVVLPEIDTGTTADAYVLLVDDSPYVLRSMTWLLERAGFVWVDAISDGREALRALQRRTPDVLVLDVCMPDLDGFAFLDEVAAHRSKTPMSILVVSGDPSTRTRDEMLARGADEYLARPCPGSELVACIRRLASRARALGEEGSGGDCMPGPNPS